MAINATRDRGPANKTLNAVNLTRLGSDRLAQLLLEAAARDAAWKRRLKFELAAEVGALALAGELDKRLMVLTNSRARVSWRKRPDLIDDLRILLGAVKRLAALEPELGLAKLAAWFDLYPSLSARVRDPKGELVSLFEAAAATELAGLAKGVDVTRATERLDEAIRTRANPWETWVALAAPGFPDPLARSLLDALSPPAGSATPRRLALIRKLADRARDPERWVATIPVRDHADPRTGAAIVVRWLKAGRVDEAREALERSRVKPVERRIWGHGATSVEPDDAWERAEVDVLEAEGATDEAQVARWKVFEQRLAADVLDAFLSRLPDFEDVETLDRAYGIAAEWPDATKGLAFLMDRGALREAAAMIAARGREINGLAEATPLWTSRLAARFPQAALRLLRAHVIALTRQGLGGTEAVRRLTAEAGDLGQGVAHGLPDHDAFLAELQKADRPFARTRR